MWSGRLVEQILDLLEKEKPDILCLQESVDLPGGNNGGFFLTLDQVMKKANFGYKFASPVLSIKFMHRSADFGCAILSKLPIVSEQTIFTNLAYKADFDFGEDDYNIRNLQHAVIGITGAKLNLLNHHGYHVPDHKNGNAETLRQMNQIGQYIDNLTGPTIFAGDLNLAPHSESLELINGRLENLSIRYNLTTTYPSLTKRTEVSDYIFINDEVKTASFRASDDFISDHKALILEFDL